MAKVGHYAVEDGMDDDIEQSKMPVKVVVLKKAMGASATNNEVASTAWLMLEDIFSSGSMPLLTKYIHEYDFYPLHIDPASLTYAQHAYYYIKHFPFMMLYYANIVLRGVGQVYICNNPVTGIFVCVGLYLTSPGLLVYALLGTLFENFGAWLICRPDLGEVDAGLFGYDGTLVGCAVYSFLSLSSTELEPPTMSNRGMLILFVLSATVGVVHASCVHMSNLPALTLAFNILTMAFLLSLARGHSNVATLTWQVPSLAITPMETDWADMSISFAIDAIFRGVGQFCFVDTTLGGGFVLLGIALCSRRAGYMALMGSITSMIMCYYVVVVPNSAHTVIRNGIYGYNSVGTCVAIGGEIFYKSGGRGIFCANTMVAVLAAALTVLMQLAIQSILNTDQLALPVLTFPFVLTASMVMLSRSEWLDPIVGEGKDLDDALQMEHIKDTWMDRPAKKSSFLESETRAAKRKELLHMMQPVIPEPEKVDLINQIINISNTSAFETNITTRSRANTVSNTTNSTGNNTTNQAQAGLGSPLPTAIFEQDHVMELVEFEEYKAD